MSKTWKLTRRDLIRTGLAAAALGVVGCKSSPDPIAGPVTPKPAAPPAKKRILILGGTGFLGPKTIDAALARGHEITIFNRGKREKIMPLEHQVAHLYGNRDPDKPADDEQPDGPKGLEQLAGKQWDAVIDNSGYFPRHVAASAKMLAVQGCTQYIFISSISAYDEASIPAAGGDETVKLATLADPKVETMGDQFENYGGLKALCEQATMAAFPEGGVVVRPGYIVGPGDPTDRFTYWPVRASQGGEVLAPGTPDDPLQWIDVRDLAEWLVHLVETGPLPGKQGGAFNAIAPAGKPGRWGDVLDTCVKASGADAKLTWVPADWLETNGQGGEDGFPIWAPPIGKYAGFHRWSNQRAVGAGATFRPIGDTVKALLAWYPGEVQRRVRVTKELQEAAAAKGKPMPPGPDPSALRAGPTREREAELLAKFHQK